MISGSWNVNSSVWWSRLSLMVVRNSLLWTQLQQGFFCLGVSCAMRYTSNISEAPSSGVTLKTLKLSSHFWPVPLSVSVKGTIYRCLCLGEPQAQRETTNTTGDRLCFWSHFPFTGHWCLSWKTLLSMNEDIHISHLLLLPARAFGQSTLSSINILLS